MLDPKDWQRFRALAHTMLDEAIGDVETIRDRPVWQPVPADIRHELASAKLPLHGTSLETIYDDFRRSIAPYATGNRHPRFFGWVHGNGTPTGMLAEMLAASLNCNTGGREHAAVYVERAVVRWWAEVFGFPEESSGIVASGTSTATLDALLVARTAALGTLVRKQGIAGSNLVGYAGVNVHSCLAHAFDIIGLGTQALRLIPLDASGTIDREILDDHIEADRRSGLTPFFLAATVGGVDTGALDDLTELSTVARRQELWFHVDGAFGALAILSRRHRKLLAGIEHADSLVFDFHKWLQVPYGAGMMLTPHRRHHFNTFADNPAYLERKRTGTAGGDPWFCDFGIELSRRFRALAVWFTMREFGLERLGQVVAMNCDLAESLAERIAGLPHFELLTPVTLNIVCARYVDDELTAPDLDRINDALAIKLQLSGEVVPSTTRVDGKLALRFNFTNHRVTTDDLDRVMTALIEASKNAKEPRT
jgi:aromatic-L-amino-acid decarboxylase